LRSLLFIDSIDHLNDAPICYQAKNDGFGEFRLKRNSKIKFIRLQYVSGSIKCSADATASRWGCYIMGDSVYTNDKIAIVITDSQNNVVFPGNPYTDFLYVLPGFTHYSWTLKVNLDHYAGRKDQVLKIWYGEDYLNSHEDNNTGEVCINVDVRYANDDD